MIEVVRGRKDNYSAGKEYILYYTMEGHPNIAQGKRKYKNVASKPSMEHDFQPGPRDERKCPLEGCKYIQSQYQKGATNTVDQRGSVVKRKGINDCLGLSTRREKTQQGIWPNVLEHEALVLHRS